MATGTYNGAAATPACDLVVPPDECLVTGGSIYHMVAVEEFDVHIMLFFSPMAEPALDVAAMQQYWNGAAHTALACLHSQQATPFDMTQAAECIMSETVPPPRGIVLVPVMEFNLHSLLGGMVHASLHHTAQNGQVHESILCLHPPSALVLLG